MLTITLIIDFVGIRPSREPEIRPDWNFDNKVEPKRPKSAFLSRGEYKPIPEPPPHSIPDSSIHPNAYVNFNANHDIYFPPALKNIIDKADSSSFRRPKSARARTDAPKRKTGEVVDVKGHISIGTDGFQSVRPLSAPSKDKASDPERPSRSVRVSPRFSPLALLTITLTLLILLGTI
jgi:hypothetical protein